jgi:hypothetical protein
MSRTVSRIAMDALRFVAATAAITAAVWMVLLRSRVTVSTDVEDALNAVAYVVLGGWILAQAIRTPTLTRKVRDGWIGRTLIVGFSTFKGTHAEFVARFRRGLSGWGWTWLIVGPLLAGLLATLILVPGVRRDPMQYPLSASTGVFFGLSLLTIGVVFLRSRRILESAQQRPTPGPAS